MVDAAAATDSPATPTSILICREDGNDIFFPDSDDGADFSVARDECLLAVDPDDEYVSVLLSKETASVARAEEMADWMKAARSDCVRWIIKVVRSRFLSFPFCTFLFWGKKTRSFSGGLSFLVLCGGCRPPRCSGSAGRRRTSR